MADFSSILDSRSCSDVWKFAKNAAEKKGVEISGRCISFTTLSAACSIALFIIACVAASGVLSPQVAGYSIAGLAGGTFLFRLCAGNVKNSKTKIVFAALLAATFVTLGALGGTGILSVKNLGISVISITLGSNFIITCCIPKPKPKAKAFEEVGTLD